MENKKTVIAVAAVVLVLAAGVYGFTQFKGAGSTSDVSKQVNELQAIPAKSDPISPGDDLLLKGGGGKK